jgi:N-acetylmuramoyl-L-alanine amidase
LRRRISLLFCLLVLFVPQLVMAATSGVIAAQMQPAMQVPATNAEPLLLKQEAAVISEPKALVESEVSTKAMLTGARWARHIDAVTGTSSLRLVFDVTGPVTADAEMTGVPTPQLIVHIKGAEPGNVAAKQALDGKIADNFSIETARTETSVIINLPLMVADGGYRVFTLRNDPTTKRPFRIVVDIDRPVPPVVYNFTPGLKNKVIAIDPGHGGSDPGAIGMNKTQEKAITLAVAQNVKTLLEKAGAKVVMTRQDDRDVYGIGATATQELNARASVANSKKADLFLSIHIDSFTSRDAGGTSTYYYQKTPYDALLAQTVQDNLQQATGLLNRGAKPANFYVIKHSIIPAILTELGFISNPAEEKLLTTPQFQQRVAEGLVQGINQFFTLAAKGRGGL